MTTEQRAASSPSAFGERPGRAEAAPAEAATDRLFAVMGVLAVPLPAACRISSHPFLTSVVAVPGVGSSEQGVGISRRSSRGAC
jgi:hypothetical protein